MAEHDTPEARLEAVKQFSRDRRNGPQMRKGDVIENNMVEVAKMITSHAPGAKAVCSTHFG